MSVLYHYLCFCDDYIKVQSIDIDIFFWFYVLILDTLVIFFHHLNNLIIDVTIVAYFEAYLLTFPFFEGFVYYIAFRVQKSFTDISCQYLLLKHANNNNHISPIIIWSTVRTLIIRWKFIFYLKRLHWLKDGKTFKLDNVLWLIPCYHHYLRNKFYFLASLQKANCNFKTNSILEYFYDDPLSITKVNMKYLMLIICNHTNMECTFPCNVTSIGRLI